MRILLTSNMRFILMMAAFVVVTAGMVFLIPSLACASDEMAQFYVSAWLVRVWLAMVGGTGIVVGVMIAQESYGSEHRLEPVLTDKGVSIVKQKRLSYRKIGGGLATVIVGCSFFVTAVFLLPDKRTGHSGISKIVTQLEAEIEVIRGKPLWE